VNAFEKKGMFDNSFFIFEKTLIKWKKFTTKNS